MIIRSLLLFLLLLTTSSDAFTSSLQQCQPVPVSLLKVYDNLKIHQYQLQNGLRILVVPHQDDSFFTMRLVYAVGGRDEPEGQSGYAHLVEHLMFKGSAELEDGEYMAQIQQSGGRSNASTDYDRTDYWAQLPLNYLERAFWMEADRMRGLTLDNEKLQNQLQAVKEEKALRLTNQPYLVPVSKFLLSEWSQTPYNKLLIGSDEDLAQADVAKMEAWLASYYHPSNAVLAITGNVDPERIRQLAEKYFGKIAAGEKRKVVKAFKVEQQQKQVSLHDSKAPWPIHAFAWQVPGFADKDSLAVRLVNDILFEKQEGIIYRQLIEQQLAFTVERLDYAFQYVSLANAIIVPRSYASTARIRSVVDTSLLELRKNGIDDQRLCRAVKSRLLDQLTLLNNPLSRITQLSNNLLFHNDARYAEKQIDKIAALTPKELQKILNHYYTRQYLLISVEPDWPTRWAKSLLEILPDSLGKSLEKSFL